jgi:hypothetical protein
MGFKFVEAFKDKAIPAIEKITEAISNFDVTPLVNIVSAAMDRIMRFADVLMGAVKIAWQFRGVIAAILIPITAVNIAFMITHGVIGISDKAINTYKDFKTIIDAVKKSTLLNAAAQHIQAIATGIATGAQTAFNIVAAANPIILIVMGAIIAIAALIAIIIFLKKNWDKVTEAVKEHFNKIMAVVTVLFWPLGLIISVIKEIVSNWGKIKDALAATGLFDKLKEIGEGIKNFFGSIGEKIVSLFNAAKEKISNFFRGIGEAVMLKIGPAVNWVTNAWHTATSIIGGFFKGIFTAVYNFVKPALDFFSEKWQEIVALFKDNAIINAIKVIGGTLLSGLLAPVQGLLEILSYIPGLGHLAGKGAEKIEELRNFLKGVDGVTVKEVVETTQKTETTLNPPVDAGASAVSPYDASGFGIPGIPGIFGADGRSKLHGVVDISGGAIPGIDGGGTYTATGAVNSASPPAAEPLITRTAIEIAAILRRIDDGVSLISGSLSATLSAPVTATQTIPITPRVRMGGDEGAGDYYNPRNVAPITQAERMAYSFSERRETIVIEVAAEKGTAARVVRTPRDIDIRLVTSGGNV